MKTDNMYEAKLTQHRIIILSMIFIMMTIKIIQNYFDITPNQIIHTIARYKRPLVYEFINRRLNNVYMKTIINFIIIIYF